MGMKKGSNVNNMCIGGTDNGEQEGPNLNFKEPVANGVLLCLRRPRRRMTMVKYTEMSELHSPERIYCRYVTGGPNPSFFHSTGYIEKEIGAEISSAVFVLL